MIEEVVCALILGVILGWLFHSSQEEHVLIIREPYEIEPYDEEEMRRFLSFFWEYNDGHLLNGDIEAELWEDQYIFHFRKSARVIQRAWRRRELKKRTIPALKIQRAWRKCISDPSHFVGAKDVC